MCIRDRSWTLVRQAPWHPHRSRTKKSSVFRELRWAHADISAWGRMETYVLNVGGGKHRGIPIACAQSFVSFWRNWRTYKHSITKAQGWRGHLPPVKTCAMIASITLTSKRRSERTGSISNLQITGNQWFLFLRATTFVTLRKHAYVTQQNSGSSSASYLIASNQGVLQGNSHAVEKVDVSWRYIHRVPDIQIESCAYTTNTERTKSVESNESLLHVPDVAELSKTVQVRLLVTSLHQIKGLCRETHRLSRK